MADKPVPGNRAGRKPGQRNRYSSATISRELMEAFHASLYVGTNPIKYCVDLRKKNPSKYADLFGIVMKRAEVEQAAEAIFQIVQLTANGALSVPGVLNSPVAANIERGRRLELVQTVEAEDADEVEGKGKP